MIYEAIIDKKSIMNLKEIIKSKLNYIIVNTYEGYYIKCIIQTDNTILDIRSDIIYYDKYGEWSIIKVDKIKKYSMFSMNKILLNEKIEYIYIIRDNIEIKNEEKNDLLKKDIALIIQFEHYSMGLFVNDYSSHILQRIDFNKLENIDNIYPLKEQYKDEYGDLFLSYKREKINISNLI